ncbi:hypothetical protein [Bartonella henselae]|uniref:hypothetical protein n=1 Tax=Bartonella henselae TaxID=38323 RepID=UPI00030057DE|nr:hypothetical protein [Bartonella henselae]ATP12882.1 hypothetical protein BhenCHDE101_07480 [Bartonella henselae]MDM9983915.1 hypothetical protein [Bartonella henselae]MDM9988262.1 hypothetical protein [Bartonella henselae]MDM9991306.1 hypothetical protein [Bartonella henselae]MDM9994193.1 hypothetical protein [Bartonella henselae]
MVVKGQPCKKAEDCWIAPLAALWERVVSGCHLKSLLSSLGKGGMRKEEVILLCFMSVFTLHAVYQIGF